MTNAFRFYFSFRSPFAGLAFYRLRRSPLFRDFEVEMIPVWPEVIFGGHMDNPSDNLFKMAYIFVDAARQAEEAGISPATFRRLAENFRVPTDIDLSQQKVGMQLGPEDWKPAHYAFLYAQQQGKQWAFGDAVFSRRFNFDGKGNANVMDPQVLADIANDVGLDREATVNAHESAELQSMHSAMIAHGERDGVFGVPFFVIDKEGVTEGFWGNDHLPYLYKALTGCAALPPMPADTLRSVQPGRD